MTRRSARNQAEVDLLPPYGEEEVHVEGAIGTAIIAGAAALAFLSAASG